ncbi:Spt20 family-domain-containing protein [Lipomyces arxii]|uniref:Spt20 family-domain-containing protein n=1 Tax=Lipomyces arxii TaxID=56418 RepID=UPI0034CD49F4
MASTASKTRPQAPLSSHRPPATSGPGSNQNMVGMGGMKASNMMAGSPINAESPGYTVKKIKLTQKNGMQNGTPNSHSTAMARKLSSAANMKSHLNNSTTPSSLAANSNATPMTRNIFLEEEAFHKVGGRRPTLNEYKFAETSSEILNKYRDSPPSIEFHMHPTHYRFGNQNAIIPKNSPLIKNFLDLVKLELIPPTAVEIFTEAGIQYYEGCIILQIYDHRDASSSLVQTESSQPGASGSTSMTDQQTTLPSKLTTPNAKTTQMINNNRPINKQSADMMKNAGDSPSLNVVQYLPASGSATSTAPKTYRVLLRPSPLTLWYDLSRYSETLGCLMSDPLSLALESEILATTMPRLDLSVPEESAFMSHALPMLRPTAAVEDQYGDLHMPNLPTNTKRARPLHEDLPHQGTEYEELMLIMDERPPPGTGQFVRLGFVEQWRRKRERDRQQRNLANLASGAVRR